MGSLAVRVMTVMAMMTMVGRLRERSGRHTKNDYEEECNLFHDLIVDAIRANKDANRSGRSFHSYSFQGIGILFRQCDLL